ncbi:hypothetical protein NQZ68_001170 [Dissostichus eleginoides]|nr:hypothetical protein NQZ68_001170 [Dissostichus eleginoides]
MAYEPGHDRMAARQGFEPFKAQFSVRPLQRAPPLCGVQNGDLERGGVEEV